MSIIEKLEKKINTLKRSKKLPEFMLLIAFMCLLGISFLLGIEYERERINQIYSIQVSAHPEHMSTIIDQEENHKDTAYFFGSKSGSVLYLRDCSAGNRVKEENRVFFSTQAEAESLGYTLSSSC